MPITPKFKLSQTNTQLIITIHIPHIRVSASTLEIIVDETEFHFYSTPYLLHLNFANDTNNNNNSSNNININSQNDSQNDDNNNNNNRILIDDESKGKESKAKYDPNENNGTLVVTIWKEVDGIWDDLDLLGRLMVHNPYNPYTTPSTSSSSSSSSSNNNGGGNGKDKIQVLASTTETESDENNETNNNDNNNENETNDNDNTINLDDLQSCFKPHYGFLQMHHSIFTAYAREGLSHDMLEIPNPDERITIPTPSAMTSTMTSNDTSNSSSTSSSNSNSNSTPIDIHSNDHYHLKREMRIQVENEKFCPNRYLGDLYMNMDVNDNDNDADMMFVEAKRMIPHWKKNKERSSNTTSVDTLTDQLQSIELKKEEKNSSSSSNSNDPIKPITYFTEKESTTLASIKAKIPPLTQITPHQTQSTFLSLLDILYAYVYDHRMTQGDPTCESSWTIVMLSPTFSWLEQYDPNHDTICTVLQYSIRRALIYPYLRNYETLSSLFVNDVLSILCQGRRVIVRCLLHMESILNKSEFHYLFNKLYVHPYICWIQCLDDSLIDCFANQVKCCVYGMDESVIGNGIGNGNGTNDVLDGSIGDRRIVLRKEDLGLDLEVLEQEAFGELESSDDEDEDTSSSDDESDSSDDESSSNSDDDDDDDNNSSTCNTNIVDVSKKSEQQHSSPVTSTTTTNGNKVKVSTSSLLDDEIGTTSTSNGRLEARGLFHIQENKQPSLLLAEPETDQISADSSSTTAKKKPLITEI